MARISSTRATTTSSSPSPTSRYLRRPDRGRRGSDAAPRAFRGGRRTRAARPEDPHENCPKNRVSFSVSARMSASWWRICAQRSMPKPKANPLHSSASIPDRSEHRRVQHAAPAELDPSGERARATPLTVADRAGDLELSRGLGEGKVARTQSRADVRTEVGAGEGLDHPGEVAEGYPSIDDETFDLVKAVRGGLRRACRGDSSARA